MTIPPWRWLPAKLVVQMEEISVVVGKEHPVVRGRKDKLALVVELKHALVESRGCRKVPLSQSPNEIVMDALVQVDGRRRHQSAREAASSFSSMSRSISSQ